MINEKYSIDQINEATLSYFNGDELAKNIWINKYALKENGDYLEKSPADMINRLTDEIYRTELKFKNPLSRDEIYKNLENFKNFIFGGSILFGLGNNHQISSLGNCFFVDNGADSYGSIFNMDETAAQLMKRRGGVGITIENLRPAGSIVNNSAQSSTGAVSFMDRYSHTTREVAQDGRRGALMISLHVNHPDIAEFIVKKDDLTKVTGANVSLKVTNEFMKAADNDEDYILTWPTKQKQPNLDIVIPYNTLYKLDDGTYVKKVKAKEIWDSLVHQAHKNAEPGVLFWDNIINESPADCYADLGFTTKGTNPCITGDTLIAVADGRNAVSIKQLVEENKDVPVYSSNLQTGKTEIKLLRHPRVTGYNKEIYEVKLDSGDSIKVTSNHKFRLKDGSYKETKDLRAGDSLHVFVKNELALDDIFKKSNSRSSNYNWVSGFANAPSYSEHRAIYEFYHNIKIPKGYVIHHKDFNSLNNSIDNLIMLSKEEHDKLHGELIKGNKNPYHKMSEEWKKNFASHPGLSNHTAYQITNNELINKGLELGKQLGRRFSKNEWIKFAKENNLPKFIKSYRGFNGITEFSKYIASKLNFEYTDLDTRIVRRYKDALLNGYNAKIENNILLVERTCEECGGKFWTSYDKREYSFCSISCSNNYLNRKTDVNLRRKITINKTYKVKGELNKENQLRIFSKLKFELDREPTINEWIGVCKKEKVPFRLATKHGFKSWDEVRENAEDYNHKVVSVNFIGYDTVYNGTVDDNHNFFVGGFESKNRSGKRKLTFVNNEQCGEVPLSSFDSCRLGSINLNNMVKNPYTDEAELDYELIEKTSRFAQRVMDDIVELEEEKVQQIIDKIINDPEEEHLKATELRTWQNVLEVLKKGRRTGVGVLGLGDMLAKLGIKYGSKEATEVIDKLFNLIAVSCYKETVLLAKERGAFPIWDYEKENNNPFLSRVLSNFTHKEYQEYVENGRRNIALLSIAPTGTMALEAQTTSGIEPVFATRSKRRKKINPNQVDTKVDFVDENGDKWEEFNVFHTEFINWFRVSEYSNHLDNKDNIVKYLNDLDDEKLDELIEKSPWAGAESHNIDYLEKVRMQGVIQKWIDHSISVTHNLPEDISKEEVKKIYYEAWKAGCKGCTIYREGSRSGVILTNKKKEEKEEFTETNAPKRPKELPADYYIAKAAGREFAVIIGLWPGTNRPYEVFAFENPPSSKNTKGRLIKVKKGHYKFINGEFEIEDVQLAVERVEQRMLTLTASMLLRHGAPIPHVINVIKKIDENITSFSSVVRRYLTRYIEDEVVREICPSCGGNNIVLEEGCKHCLDCGWSACG